MRTITRVVVVRDSEGNDVSDSFQVPQCESMTDVINSFGDEYAIRVFNANLIEEAKRSRRNEIAYNLRNKR